MFYYRRKIILALFELFDGQLTAKSFQKLLFLFTRKQDVKSFDFIPYKYGCFSFQANQDVVTLEKYGFLRIEENNNIRCINLIKTDNYLGMLNIFDRSFIENIKVEFGGMSQNDLIRYTYVNYPFYAINSSIANDILTNEEIEKISQQRRHKDSYELFTIGYEGISLEKYINLLIIKDVKVLCDVRKNALSQKYGFSKSQLQKACEGVKIKYVHIPQLGINSDKRQELNCQSDYDKLFKLYESTTLIQNKDYLLEVRKLIDKYKRVALTCFEKNPVQCHRSYVAKELMKLEKVNYKLTNIQ